MIMTKKQWFLLILMLTMLVQSACTTVVPVNSVALTNPAEPTSSTDECPTATADLKLLTNTEGGYCLLYPAEYSTGTANFIVINPTTAGGDMLGDAWVNISVTDAQGQTAAQVADAASAGFGEGFNITKTDNEVDGAQGVVVDGLPGQDSNRQVFIVKNDKLYQIVFEPWYPNTNSPTPLENLYTTITQTFHFLSPK
jgi:hypothetical protein